MFVLPHPANLVDLPIAALLVLLDLHHVLKGGLVLVLEGGLEQHLHPLAAALFTPQGSHSLAVGGEVIHLLEVGRDSEMVQDLLHAAVLSFELGMGVQTIIGVAATLDVVVLNEVIGSKDVHGAGDECQIGVHKLVLVLELVLEQIQLMDDEHLNIVLPPIGILLQVDHIVDLLNERLAADVVHPAYLLRVVQSFPGQGSDSAPVLSEQDVVGLLPHVLQQEEEDEVDLAVPIIEDKPVVHSLQVGELNDAGDALLAERFAAEVDEVVDEQHFVDVQLVLGEDGGEPVEEVGMGGVHDEVVQTFHQG